MVLQLPLGDVNVIAVTDVHSWVAGHGRHEPDKNADYGDVLSFYQLLSEAAVQQGKDVFFVMNGDFVDGTGLSSVPPEHLTPILQQMPFAAVNMGNHELYHNATVAFLRDSGFIDHWKGNYLTTNTYWQETKNHIGHPFTYLYGKHSQTKILTFGFLYNFEYNCGITLVKKVQETVQMEWFQQVLLQNDYDAILVLAHMDYIDPLVSFLHQRIRALVGPEMPIQFINGHSHRRGFYAYDKTCTAFEAGRFLDTVGFVSFPTIHSVRKSESPETLFQHVFLDANKEVLANAVGNDTKTSEGSSLTDFIHQTQNDNDLEHVLGCSSQNYYAGKPFTAPDSLYGLYMQKVLTHNFGYNQSKIFVQGTDALRYNLFEGQVTVDDLIAVSPFEDLIYFAAQNVTGADILDAFGQKVFLTPHEPAFSYHWSGLGIDPSRMYDLYAADFELVKIRKLLQETTGRELEPAILWTRDGSAVTTSNVWHNYVVDSWPCSECSTARRLAYEPRSSVYVGYTSLFVITCLAILIVVYRITKHRTNRYRDAASNEIPNYGSINESR